MLQHHGLDVRVIIVGRAIDDCPSKACKEAVQGLGAAGIAWQVALLDMQWEVGWSMVWFVLLQTTSAPKSFF
jgi:hypothetical protein